MKLETAVEIPGRYIFLVLVYTRETCNKGNDLIYDLRYWIVYSIAGSAIGGVHTLVYQMSDWCVLV